jgi:pimeloyl-ACP methyl ester carboxylesterase
VLLVHGWGASVYTFRALLPALARAGLRCFAVDLRGHGLSSAGDGSYTTATLLTDLRAIIGELGGRQLDLVGHSMGGGLALRLGIESPRLVRRLVLAAPVGLGTVRFLSVARLLTPKVPRILNPLMVPRSATAALIRGAYGDPNAVSDDVIDQYWAPSQFATYYPAVRSLLADFDWSPLPVAQLHRLALPTLVILGTADRLIPDGRDLAGELSNASVLLLQGAGHLGIEEQAAPAQKAIVSFLAS